MEMSFIHEAEKNSSEQDSNKTMKTKTNHIFYFNFIL